MKKTLLFVLMILAAATAAITAMGSKDQPSIVFEEKTHDFGVIHEKNGPVTCEFKFTNKGKAPLVIVSATAGCGCTKPSFEGEPIAPGKSSTIKVTYSPKGRLGEFNKFVNIRTNDPKNKKVNLKITGNVVE